MVVVRQSFICLLLYNKRYEKSQSNTGRRLDAEIMFGQSGYVGINVIIRQLVTGISITHRSRSVSGRWKGVGEIDIFDYHRLRDPDVRFRNQKVSGR